MFRRRTTRCLGLIILCIGVGITLAVLIPLWGWMIAVGGAVIVAGWWIMNKWC